MAGVPLHFTALIILSRRFQAVHTLGLFNDCWCALGIHATVVLAQLGLWFPAVAVWSLSVGIKMNALLLLPGLMAVLVREAVARRRRAAKSFATSKTRVTNMSTFSVAMRWLQRVWPEADVLWLLQLVLVVLCVQVGVGAPFLMHSPGAYLEGAFNLGRAFDRTYSVSWRFLPEPWFQSKIWHGILLAVHVAGVVALLGSRGCGRALTPRCRCDKDGDTIVGPTGKRDKYAIDAIDSQMANTHADGFFTGFRSAPSGSTAWIALALYGSNMIGITMARSLHYQFLVWYWASLPLLLWQGGIPWYGALVWIVALEVGWNCHEPAVWSSLLVTMLHLGLSAALLGTRYSTRSSNVTATPPGRRRAQ